MSLSGLQVALSGLVCFIAWGFVTHWFPPIRWIGWALVSGFALGVLSIFVLAVLSARPPQHDDDRPLPRLNGFKQAWPDEEKRLETADSYSPQSLFSSSFLVSRKFDSLLSILLHDFIGSWYKKITPTPYFTNEIDRSLRYTVLEATSRLSKHDLIEVAVSRLTPIFTAHLRTCLEAEYSVRGKRLDRNVTESQELDMAIAARYNDGKLHPAVTLGLSDTKAAQQEYLRSIVVRLLPKLANPNLLQSRVVTVLMREIIACAILQPVMQMLSDPDLWNRMIEAYGSTTLQDRKTVKRLRAALDQHASPPTKQHRSNGFPRLSQGDDERRFERLIRAIRQSTELSEVLRYRTEISSQLKVAMQADEYDALYVRRLESCKRALDHTISVLSAVGETKSKSAVTKAISPAIRKVKNFSTDWKQHQPSLMDVLHSTSGLSYFMEFMDRLKLTTLVQFFIVVEGLRDPLEADTAISPDMVTRQFTEAERTDLASIASNYSPRPELGISKGNQQLISAFVKSGRQASSLQYSTVRSIVLQTQTSAFEEMRDKHFPVFKKSDLWFKFLASEDFPQQRERQQISRPASPLSTPKPSILSRNSDAPIGHARPPVLPRMTTSHIKTNSSSAADLRMPFRPSLDGSSKEKERRSFDLVRSDPLFDDDIEPEHMTQSLHSLDERANDSGEDEKQVVERIEEALNEILTDPAKGDGEQTQEQEAEQDEGIDFDNFDGVPESSQDNASIFSGKGSAPSVLSQQDAKSKEKPNLASLGLLNAKSRFGVFVDDDLFGEEEKLADEDQLLANKSDEEELPVEDEIVEAAPGDLGLAEAIAALTRDIDKLVAQECIIDTLNRKAELTNNVAELRILGKSKSSLQREIRRKELQRQQYIVQESDNSLFGRASVSIKNIMVGKDNEGQEFALYVVEVSRRAGDGIISASWAIARRYSEFHELHQRLRARYPAVRGLEFPRRRIMLKLQKDFLRKRRAALEGYLRALLQIPAVCQSRELRAFLSQQAIIANANENDKESNSKDIVTRIYNSVTDGMDEFLGNMPVLDQLSVAGQNLVSAATTYASILPLPSSSTGPPINLHDPITDPAVTTESTMRAASEAQAELDAYDTMVSKGQAATAAAQAEPFVKPICDLFLELFDLRRSQNWLRGRAVVVVLHQLLGGTVERKIREAAKTATSPENLVKYIDIARDTLYTATGENPVYTRRPSVARTTAQQRQAKREASAILATLMPDIAGSVVGRANALAAGRKVWSVLNNQRLNAHLVYTLLDEVVAVLLEEK